MIGNDPTDRSAAALMADIDGVMGRLESINPASDSEARIIAAIGELLLVVARLLPEEA